MGTESRLTGERLENRASEPWIAPKLGLRLLRQEGNVSCRFKRSITMVLPTDTRLMDWLLSVFLHNAFYIG